MFLFAVCSRTSRTHRQTYPVLLTNLHVHWQTGWITTLLPECPIKLLSVCLSVCSAPKDSHPTSTLIVHKLFFCTHAHTCTCMHQVLTHLASLEWWQEYFLVYSSATPWLKTNQASASLGSPARWHTVNCNYLNRGVRGRESWTERDGGWTLKDMCEGMLRGKMGYGNPSQSSFWRKTKREVAWSWMSFVKYLPETLPRWKMSWVQANVMKNS